MMLVHALKCACLLLALALATSGAGAVDTRKPELLLVYWSSADCRWCTYWESARSGMQEQLREAEEFKRVTFRVVKNERLADPYVREHFPADVQWLYERVQRGAEQHPGRPGWVLYVDRKRVAGFYGATHWEEQHLPEIKRLIRLHSRD
jgi:hypothetical protein